MSAFKQMKNLQGWGHAALLLVALLTAPLLSVFTSLFSKNSAYFVHVRDTLLLGYVSTSISLVSITVVVSLILGVSSAWFVTQHTFATQKFFSWALLLPLAIPPYMGGYVYSSILSYGGWLYKLFANLTGHNNFDIMNTTGAGLLFAFFLYPYVFMASKTFFSHHLGNVLESAAVLGLSRRRSFFRVVLPLGRRVFVAASFLVALEVLNDYGLVHYFGLSTFSVGIFKLWFSYHDLEGAIKLAFHLILMVLFLLFMQHLMQGRRNFAPTSSKVRPHSRAKGNLAMQLWLGFIFLLTFALPVGQLVYWAGLSIKSFNMKQLVAATAHSLALSLAAALLILIIALIISNATRLQKGRFSSALVHTSSLGYSIPGAVVAIGMISFFVALDKFLLPLYERSGLATNLFMSSALVMLLFAYSVRFLAVALSQIEASQHRIGVKFHQVARTLGFNITQTFFKLDIHLLKTASFAAVLLVFIEVIKELPVTMILRPFNFNTLATLASQYAEDEMVQQSAIPSLVLILLALGAIMLLTSIFNKRRVGR